MAAHCPYCSAALEKAPQRKTRCPSCGEPIHVKSSPEDRTRRLMTAAQAIATEEAWRLHHSEHRSKALLEEIGASPEQLQALAAAANVVDMENAFAAALVDLAANAPRLHQRIIAHGRLADLLAVRGDPRFMTHLKAARHYKLQQIAAHPIGIDLVDIKPGGEEPVCLAMRRQALPIGAELRNQQIPNPECPRSRGKIERGYCTCFYLVSLAWFERRRA